MKAFKKRLEVACRECGVVFVQSRKDRWYCSRKCKFKAWAKEHPRIKKEVV
jgi:endogenous inhibitor of DNA gyrase (YacG/DUF329 family)